MHKKLYSLELIEMMSGEDEAFVRKMTSLFLTQTPELLNRIKKGFSQEDHLELKLAAHKLISSIDMMEIDALKTVVRDIEKMGINKSPWDKIKIKIDFLEEHLILVMNQLKELN